MESLIRRGACLALALALVAGPGGCRFFTPAEPEPPSGSAITPDYRTREATLETIVKALRDKARTNGLTAYIGAFTDNFEATFDPLTKNRYEAAGGVVPPTWRRADEENFYGWFATLYANEEYETFWDPDPSRFDIIETETAILYRQYKVFALSQTGGDLLIANGFAELHFVKVSTDWKIVRWLDGEAPADPMQLDAVSFGQRRLESQ